MQGRVTKFFKFTFYTYKSLNFIAIQRKYDGCFTPTINKDGKRFTNYLLERKSTAYKFKLST